MIDMICEMDGSCNFHDEVVISTSSDDDDH